MDELPPEALALFRGQPEAARPTEGDAFVYSQGGVGIFGETGVKEAQLKPNRWQRVVVTMSTTKGEMRTYVNSKLCAVVEAKDRGAIGIRDGRFALDPTQVMLFGSIEPNFMPGACIKYASVERGALSEEQVKEQSAQNKLYSFWEVEQAKSKEAERAEFSLQPLYKRPPPMWMHPAFLCEFGEAFLGGMAGGGLDVCLSAFSLVIDRAVAEQGAFLTGLTHQVSPHIIVSQKRIHVDAQVHTK